jgi:hypothetical protein
MAELERIRWYNPESGNFEWREVPNSDEDALALLGGSPHTQACTDTYLYWRNLDATITAALLRAGERALEEHAKQAVP